MADNYTPRMRKLYDDQIVKAMTEKFGYKNARWKFRRSRRSCSTWAWAMRSRTRRRSKRPLEMELITQAKARYHQGEEVDCRLQAA